MAEEDLSSPIDSLSAGNDSKIPSLKYSETSYNGLRVAGGIPYEECLAELRFPRSIETFKKMAKDGTISPALNLVEMMISMIPWEIKIPKGYEVELKTKAEFTRQNMNDMEHSWGSFIRQVVSFNRYGFANVEKVYRKRLKSNGSKYDDGLIGLRKLPLISQDTITSFEWLNEGRDLSALWQSVMKPTGVEQGIQTTYSGEKVRIPRKKFLLFRNGILKNDPLGQSPLVGCHEAWKYKKAFEEVEALGVSQDMTGFKVLYIPPRYMAADATVEDKAVFEVYQKMMSNAHVGKQSGFILPQVLDENGKEYFKFDIVDAAGTKSYDIGSIIHRYSLEILTALAADFLVLGQSGSGSFALSENKASVSETAIESKLIEIQDQLNHDLIPQLFSLNGWSLEVLPYFEFGSVKKTDLDILSKFIQRVGAAGLLPQTPETVAWLCDKAGIPYQIKEDLPREEFLKLLTAYNSNAGQSTGNGGTSTSPSSKDTSSSNKENA